MKHFHPHQAGFKMHADTRADLHVHYPLLLPDFNHTWNVPQILTQLPNINFIKIH